MFRRGRNQQYLFAASNSRSGALGGIRTHSLSFTRRAHQPLMLPRQSGEGGIRTLNRPRAKRVLFQLSYNPIFSGRSTPIRTEDTGVRTRHVSSYAILLRFGDRCRIRTWYCLSPSGLPQTRVSRLRARNVAALAIVLTLSGESGGRSRSLRSLHEFLVRCARRSRRPDLFHKFERSVASSETQGSNLWVSDPGKP